MAPATTPPAAAPPMAAVLSVPAAVPPPAAAPPTSMLVPQTIGPHIRWLAQPAVATPSTTMATNRIPRRILIILLLPVSIPGVQNPRGAPSGCTCHICRPTASRPRGVASGGRDAPELDVLPGCDA